MDLEWRWREATRNHFGAASARKWFQLYTDVRCVALGLKPAFLLDYVAPDAQKIQALLEDVSVHSGDLCILTVGEDVLLTNERCFSAVLSETATEQKQHFEYVDVTKGLQSPCLLAEEKRTELNKEFTSWCEDMTLKLQMEKRVEPDVHHIPILATPGIVKNTCTSFGQLVGYPVVYWFDTERGFSLDMVELVQHSFSVHCSTPSTAVPDINFWLLDKVSSSIVMLGVL